MRILGLNIHGIMAERKSALTGKIEINNNINIDNIQKEEASLSNKPLLKFDFTYKLTYGANLAVVEMKGAVMVIDENDQSKEILKEWKNKKFNHNFKFDLLNFIVEKCSIRALELEEDINLPPHIQFPKIVPSEKEKPAVSEQSEKKPNRVNYTG